MPDRIIPDWIMEALQALRPPGRLTVSEWADANRVLTSGESNKPGRWRTDFTPYLREIMDAFTAPDVEEIILVKPTQVGGTEAMLNMMGYAICNDPAPMLVVYPQKELAESVSDHRIQPMIPGVSRASPALRREQQAARPQLYRRSLRGDRRREFAERPREPPGQERLPRRGG